MSRRKLQEINAGSMADIAFLLLVFFLVATTMNVDSGIHRILPPMPDPNQAPSDIKERNVMEVMVSKTDAIMVDGKEMDLLQLTEKTKAFILNIADDANLPEKVLKDIDLIGEYYVSSGVVALKNDRNTSYDMYIKVQNELTRAFREVRDILSISKFGKSFDDLEDDQKAAVAKAIPLKLSESQPNEGEN